MKLAAMVVIASVNVALASEALKYEKDALKGNYQAQRNWAYSLAHGDGVRQNVIEACAWRLIIVSTQHALVSQTDASNLDGDCQNQSVADAGEKRARTIIKSLPLRTRSVAGDLSDLTDGACPGTGCVKTYGTFASIYERGVAGDVSAMRELGRCFSSRCEQFPQHDLFQACIWIKRVMASVGNSASREDRVLFSTTCGFLGERANRTADQMVRAIGQINRR